jgi:hypothetical protein
VVPLRYERVGLRRHPTPVAWALLGSYPLAHLVLILAQPFDALASLSRRKALPLLLERFAAGRGQTLEPAVACLDAGALLWWQALKAFKTPA